MKKYTLNLSNLIYKDLETLEKDLETLEFETLEEAENYIINDVAHRIEHKMYKNNIAFVLYDNKLKEFINVDERIKNKVKEMIEEKGIINLKLDEVFKF